MSDFDRKIKELSRNVDVPAEYSERVEKVLSSLPDEEDEDLPRRGSGNKKKSRLKWSVGVAAFVLCMVFVLAVNSKKAEANILETFKQTILGFLNVNTDTEMSKGKKKEEGKPEDRGVSSITTEVVSKPDLMLETKEIVVSPQGVYLLLKVTAPPNVVLSDNITFDYFVFCEGENYNLDNLIGGGIDCRLFETMEEKPNVATYMMTLTADMRAYEGKMISACFKDLTKDPNGDNPELLVEGIWSLSFMAEMTVNDNIDIEGDSDMVFPYINTIATVERIEITPLGFVLTADVSNFPYDELGVSDTTITLRLKMIDGSEITLSPYIPEEEWIVESSGSEFDIVEGKNIQKDIYSFNKAIDLNNLVGVYIQDVYFSVR